MRQVEVRPWTRQEYERMIARRLEVYREPAPEPAARHGWAYQSLRHFSPGERVSPAALPEAFVSVGDLLA
jgi:hypothetical protein